MHHNLRKHHLSHLNLPAGASGVSPTVQRIRTSDVGRWCTKIFALTAIATPEGWKRKRCEDKRGLLACSASHPLRRVRSLVGVTRLRRTCPITAQVANSGGAPSPSDRYPPIQSPFSCVYGRQLVSLFVVVLVVFFSRVRVCVSFNTEFITLESSPSTRPPLPRFPSIESYRRACRIQPSPFAFIRASSTST